MPNAAEVLKSVNRTRRNLFKAGSTLGAFALASMLSSLSRKSDAAVLCFGKGTRIATVEGEQPIETLTVGSQVPAMFGGAQPIRAVSRQILRKIAGSPRWPEEQMLVRIARSALAPDVPRADLFVTRNHAIYIDGVLVPALNLVNGDTVSLFAPERDEFEVYHIKLERHDVIRAEGALCETSRRTADEAACLPLLAFQGGRSEIRSRLRSALSPWVDRREKIDVLRDYLEEHGLFEARPFSSGG